MNRGSPDRGNRGLENEEDRGQTRRHSETVTIDRSGQTVKRTYDEQIDMGSGPTSMRGANLHGSEKRRPSQTINAVSEQNGAVIAVTIATETAIHGQIGAGTNDLQQALLIEAEEEQPPTTLEDPPTSTKEPEPPSTQRQTPDSIKAGRIVGDKIIDIT